MERINNRNDIVEFLAGLPQKGESSTHIGGCILTASRYNGGFSCKVRSNGGFGIKDGNRDYIINWLKNSWNFGINWN